MPPGSPRVSSIAGSPVGSERQSCLTAADAVSYLLAHEFLPPSAVTDGDVVVAEISRRHRSFLVGVDDGAVYLVKQAVHPSRTESLRREAEMYHLLAMDHARGYGLRFLPRFLRYDADRHILVLERVKRSTDLRSYSMQYARCTVRAGALVGQALAGLHRIDLSNFAAWTDLNRVAISPPWVVNIGVPRIEASTTQAARASR